VSQSDQPAETVSIVGVVADAIRLGSTARYSGVIYLPFRHDYGRHLVFTARATRDPAALADVIRQTLRDLDPDVAVRVAGAGPSVIGSTAQFFQISAAIASLLGTFAWILALVGLYGVLSHLVSRRTREIGVRVALGASRAQITRLVVTEGLSPVVVGIVLGLTLGALASMALQARFLRYVPTMDVVLLVVVPGAFIVAAVLACYLPARRAASVDPNSALRGG
jgi:putative ABC transport system permease protein